MEFVQRVDSELTDLNLYGVEVPDENSISALRQGVGQEYDVFIRMLIHQKSTYEVIKDELINYDFHSTAACPTTTVLVQLRNNILYVKLNLTILFLLSLTEERSHGNQMNHVSNLTRNLNLIDQINFKGKANVTYVENLK